MYAVDSPGMREAKRDKEHHLRSELLQDARWLRYEVNRWQADRRLCSMLARATDFCCTPQAKLAMQSRLEKRTVELPAATLALRLRVVPKKTDCILRICEVELRETERGHVLVATQGRPAYL